MVALTPSQIYLMYYLIDITNFDKLCDYGKYLNICANSLVVEHIRGGENFKKNNKVNGSSTQLPPILVK